MTTQKQQSPAATQSIGLAVDLLKLVAEATNKVSDSLTIHEYESRFEPTKVAGKTKEIQRIVMVVTNGDQQVAYGLEGGNSASITPLVMSIVTSDLLRMGWYDAARTIVDSWESYKASGNAGAAARLTSEYTTAISTAQGRALLAQLATQLGVGVGNKVALIFQVAADGEKMVPILIAAKPSNERENAKAAELWEADYNRVGHKAEVRSRAKTETTK